jgi:hypothetical protein
LNEYPRVVFSYTGQSAVASGVNGIEVGISVGINSGVSVGGIGTSIGCVVVGEQETITMARKMKKVEVFIADFSPLTRVIR